MLQPDELEQIRKEIIKVHLIALKTKLKNLPIWDINFLYDVTESQIKALEKALEKDLEIPVKVQCKAKAPVYKWKKAREEGENKSYEWDY